MQVNMNNTHYNPNFEAVYRVHDAYINGKHYRYKNKKDLQRAALALSNSIIHNSLSPELKEKVYSFFPDLKEHSFIRAARYRDRIPWKDEIVIMSAEDAQKYYNAYQTEKNTQSDDSISQWILSDMVKGAWNKRIAISADEANGKLIVTDIKKVQKGPMRRKRHT